MSRSRGKTSGEGPGWHREHRRHHDAALKNPRQGRDRSSRKGKTVTTTGGMYVTTYPVKTVKVGKKEYDIPTGPGGKVPEEALVSRFLNTEEGDRGGGKRNVVVDINDYAKVRINENPTAEEAAPWWAHPNESDIKGIDDPFQNIFGGLETASKGSKEANKSIAIMGGTPEQQKTVREAIASSFTVAEQKKMCGTTIYITDLTKAAGEYHGKGYGGSFIIKLDRHNGIDSDCVTHELIHHLRTVDDKRDDPLVKARQPYYGKDRDLEEAATVAESMVEHLLLNRDKERHNRAVQKFISGLLNNEGLARLEAYFVLPQEEQPEIYHECRPKDRGVMAKNIEQARAMLECDKCKNRKCKGPEVE